MACCNEKRFWYKTNIRYVFSRAYRKFFTANYAVARMVIC